MKLARLKFDHQWEILTENVVGAYGFWQRLVGLLKFQTLPCDFVMAFPQAWALHTFGMKFPIDIIFVDRQDRVQKIFENVKPGQLAFCEPWKSSWALETASGNVQRWSIQKGQIIRLIEDVGA